MEEVVPILAIEYLIDIVTMMIHLILSEYAYVAWNREPIILSVFAVFPESLSLSLDHWKLYTITVNTGKSLETLQSLDWRHCI